MLSLIQKPDQNAPFLYVPAIHKLYFFFIIKYVTMNKCMTVNQMNKI